MANKTIIDKIKDAGEYLGVSRSEIMNQMIEFAKLDDKEGMKQMFEEYRNWELKGVEPAKDKIEEKIQLAQENFDYVAEIADNYIKTNSVFTSLLLNAKLPTNISGPVQNLYREAIGYHPVDTKMN